jgi:prepilin-type N-terminal cleavage/methylation domain-containing protein
MTAPRSNPLFARRAFTLIELLVVVSIIALLIAIMLPSMSRAQEAARRAVCGSQLHQQSVATVAYATSNLRYYPPPVTSGHWPDGDMVQDDGHSAAGQAVLFEIKYLVTPQIMYCPSHVKGGEPWGKLFTLKDGWRGTYNGAGNPWNSTWTNYPAWARYRNGNNPDLANLVADGMTATSDRIVYSDDITIDTGTLSYTALTRNHASTSTNPDGGNVLLNDASVTWRNFAQTILQVTVPFGSGTHDRQFYF